MEVIDAVHQLHVRRCRPVELGIVTCYLSLFLAHLYTGKMIVRVLLVRVRCMHQIVETFVT